MKRMRGKRPDPQLPPSHIKKVALKKEDSRAFQPSPLVQDMCIWVCCFVVPSCCCFVVPAWSLRGGGGWLAGGGGVITTDGAPVFVCTEM